MYENQKRRFRDRKDGFLLHHVTPLFMIIPYIMKKRDDSQVLYEFDADITKAEELLRSYRKSEYKGLSYTHLVMAVTARTYAENPRMNRFVIGRRVYARNELKFSLAAKASIEADADELLLVTRVNPRDTILDIAAKFDKEYEDVVAAKNHAVEKKNNRQGDEVRAKKGFNKTDILVKLFRNFPRWLLKMVVGAVEALDYYGLAPKALTESLPFYSSAFVTNMGSLGADAVYHHLYNFGTTSVFIGMGSKRIEHVVKANGEIEKQYHMTFRIVIDERICDGSNFIIAMKDFKHYIENPSRLFEKGEKDLVDPDI